jgi:hypothetical protein
VNHTLIYSQPNWPEEFQQLLAIELQELRGRFRYGAQESSTLSEREMLIIYDLETEREKAVLEP